MRLRSSLREGLIQVVAGLRLGEVSLWLQRVELRRTGPQVLVVEVHETLKKDAAQFQRQLAWVTKHFTIISPGTFFELWDRTYTDLGWAKPAVLFTFDDGRESNYEVAAPLLESMGARGLFFVVPDFIGLRGDEARNFYYSKIDIRGLPPAESEEVWTPMSPQQLLDLVRRGHGVGNHTLSHVSLAGLASSELQRQVEQSSEKIATWTQKKVEAFAWPYAWNAITREAWDLIRRTHRFCFSPCPGTMHCSLDSPHLIWRTEIESYYSDPQYRFMYSGMVNPIWAEKRKLLRVILET
jgi:peptidoglycan/xylan/chitin deacetylase (PgdA/CDA1 family)